MIGNKQGLKEIVIIVLAFILFAAVSGLSYSSIKQLQGNAKVINHVGMVRAGMQMLVKEELQGTKDDVLIGRLDRIVDELSSGEGNDDLPVLDDIDYLSKLLELRTLWSETKAEIELFRISGNGKRLFDLSQYCYYVSSQAASSAEVYSEAQVQRTTVSFIAVATVFIMLVIFVVLYLIRSSNFKKRADALDKLVYTDPLTKMPNRSSCEREISKLTQRPPLTQTAAIMFDMNNLKRVNNVLGHAGGDRLIAEFAKILMDVGGQFGFVGRYGGDEFLALFTDSDESIVEEFISDVNKKTVAYNLLNVDEINHISFAVGYKISTLNLLTPAELINDADRLMYIKKRQMKDDKDSYYDA